MRAMANGFRQWDEDPYRQAHPAPAPAKPRSPWVDAGWIAFGVVIFALSYLIGAIRQAHP